MEPLIIFLKKLEAIIFTWLYHYLFLLSMKLADEQGLSINQLAMYMFTKELAVMDANKKLSHYWANHSKSDIYNDFDEVISKVKDNVLPKWDIIENDK